LAEGPCLEVALGSQNPVKVDGVREAFEAFYGCATVIPVSVSGLPPQPVGLEQTRRLAMLRASRALEATRARVGVGVESGMFKVDSAWYVITVACVMKDGKVACGTSPAFEVPEDLARDSMSSELDRAVEARYGIRDIGSREGIIGLMTKGVVVRKDLVRWASLMALAGLNGLPQAP
jgi:inosine/xanthosine triphosphatase